MQNGKEISNYALTWNEIQRFSYRQGLPQNLIKEFLLGLKLCLQNNGPEWTISRYKSIGNLLRAYYASGFDKKSLVGNQVKKTSAGNFAGVFGKLQTLCKSQHGFVKVMKLCKVTSSFIATSPTPTQIGKFKEAVLTDRSLDTPKEYLDMMLYCSRRLSLPVFPKGVDVLTSPRNKENQDGRFLGEWMSWSRSKSGLEVITQQDWFNQFMIGDENLLGMMGFRSCSSARTTVGNIYCSQEPGYKLRCFAAPMMWTQACLEPLKVFLMNLIKTLPWDLTHDQTSSDGIIQERMKLGGMVHCYDLSNASDLIPWDSQEAILRQIVPFDKTHYVDLFKYVAKGKWLFTPTGEEISWNRGQPLGSGPSFGSFALWHGLLLLSLNGGEHNEDFFIVGDDVVILDDNLANFYEQALKDLSLDWSPLKTMHSNRVAEFTGRLITPMEVNKIPKWKKFTETNFVDNLFNLGPAFMDFVPKVYRKVMEAVVSLPEPWGIGYNPQGLSLSQRLNGAEYLLVSDTVETEYDLLPSRRAYDRISALSDLDCGRFYSLSSTRRFEDSLVAQDALAKAKAITEIGDRSKFLLSDDLNLNGLLQERFTQVADWRVFLQDSLTHTRVRSSLPISRVQKKTDKKVLKRASMSLKNTAHRWKPLLSQQ